MKNNAEFAPDTATERQLYKRAVCEGIAGKERIRAAAKTCPQRKIWKVAVAVLLALIALGGVAYAIPPVRAAIGEWLGLSFNAEQYLTTPADQREVRTVVEDAIQNLAQPGSFSWEITGATGDLTALANALDVTLDEALYDGKYLYITGDLGCDMPALYAQFIYDATRWFDLEWTQSEREALLALGIDLDAALRMYAALDAQALYDPNGVVTLPDQPPLPAPWDVRDPENPVYTGTFLSPAYLEKLQEFLARGSTRFLLQFAPSQPLEGSFPVRIGLRLDATDLQRSSPDSATLSPAGSLTLDLNLRLDASAGASSQKTLQRDLQVAWENAHAPLFTLQENPDAATMTARNATTDLSGCALQLTEVRRRLTGMDITLRVQCPDHWTQQQINTLRDNLCFSFALEGAEGTQQLENHYWTCGNTSLQDGALVIVLEDIPLLPDDLATATVLRIQPETFHVNMYNRVDMPQDNVDVVVPRSIKPDSFSSVKEWDNLPLEGCALWVALPLD